MLPQDAWEDRAGPILPFVFQAEITLRGLLEVGRGHGELSPNSARLQNNLELHFKLLSISPGCHERLCAATQGSYCSEEDMQSP